MNQEELLPNFSVALEAGLPEFAENKINSMSEQYNETDSQLFVNAAGTRGALLTGIIGAAAGVGGTLLAKDLINKNKKKKEEEKRKADEAAAAAAASQTTPTKSESELAAMLNQQGGADGGGKKTMMYVGIGVGVLVLLVGVVALARR